MSNPWLKKNPFLSVWLSTAHRVMGSLRGHATAQAKRQVMEVVKDARSAPAPSAASVAKPVPRTKPKPKPKPKPKLKSKPTLGRKR